MHRDVVSQLFAATVEHHDDGVHAATGLLVQVGLDHLAGAGGQTLHGTHGDVFLERGEHLFDLLSELAGRGLATSGDGGSHLRHEVHEVLALGDEVGLALDFHNGGVRAVTNDRDGTFRVVAVSALRGRRETLHAQPLRGGLKVTVVLLESLLGVEHADTGGLTKGLYVLGGNCHEITP